ncbi:GNAT family N-acetyltransferase [Micromonospora sp. NPDC049559]|uniref:GNAT family N-acetyltransferase n=1 Tax=Micromonospora sp. NPDC049559 TaxID=3155923 RepID=UPI003448DC56
MINVRRALASDVDELVRLRGVMLGAIHGRTVEPGSWPEAAARSLRERLPGPEPSLVAFVVERPDEPGRLAACVLGAVESRLPGPSNPSGLIGHVFNVVTDPDHRRRGYSRACMEALLDWYRRRGVTRIELNASPAGEPLYRSLGFTPRTTPAMRLTTPTN